MMLADEINRTPPKTQAALLEAMQEHQVTAGGTDVSPARAVLRAGDAESDRAGRHLSAARGAARPLHVQRRRQLSQSAEEVEIMKQTTSTAPSRAGARPVGGTDPAAAGSGAPGGGGRPCVRLCGRPGAGHPAAASRTSPKFIPELVVLGAGPRASQYLILAARPGPFSTAGCTSPPTISRRWPMPVLRHRLCHHVQRRRRGRHAGRHHRAAARAVPLPQEEAAAKVKP